MITAKRLQEALNYNSETGVFVWLIWRGYGAPAAGSIAGSFDAKGYLTIQIDGRHYKAHRLAVLYMTGEWPIHEVDHWNTDKADNRWKNIREATHAQNQMNRPRQRNNKSGFKGVSWDAQMKRWRAYIGSNSRHHHLGFFDTPEAAHAAYVTVAKNKFGKFARIE